MTECGGIKILDVLDGEYDFPIIKSNNFGHCDKKTVIPIGIKAKMVTNETIKIPIMKKQANKSFIYLTSVFLINPEDKRILLVKHKKFNKWVQPGGHIEDEETPEEAALREVYEETGLCIQPQLRGILTFILPKWENEITFLYTSNTFEGTLKECNEGHLQWIDKNKVLDLKMEVALCLNAPLRRFLPLRVRAVLPL